MLNSGGDVINNQLVDSRVVNNCNEYVKVVIAASRGKKTSKTVIRKENILTTAKKLTVEAISAISTWDHKKFMNNERIFISSVIGCIATKHADLITKPQISENA